MQRPARRAHRHTDHPPAGERGAGEQGGENMNGNIAEGEIHYFYDNYNLLLYLFLVISVFLIFILKVGKKSLSGFLEVQNN